MRPPSILYKMMWGKIEKQAAFSEEAYGSGTPAEYENIIPQKGNKKNSTKGEDFSRKFCMKKSTKNKIKCLQNAETSGILKKL